MAEQKGGLSVKLEGDWDEWRRYALAFDGELAKAAEQGTKRATLYLVSECQARMHAGRYRRLAPLTAMMRALQGYGQTPLVRTNAMTRAITREVVSPWRGEVGIDKNARAGRGRGSRTTPANLGSIAMLLHEGGRIRITDEMRRAFARRLHRLMKKNGGASRLPRRGSSKGYARIPPRPYIRAVFEDAAVLERVKTIYADTIQKVAGF